MERPGEHESPPHAAPPPASPPAEPSAPPSAAPADPEALRGTRFEFGGRRPYAFSPPRVTSRGPARAMPGIGTAALGRVVRIVPYGAFVDFLGFRGMIHVSQLLPGQRVDRVEDVVQVQDEVQVRVIGVDPERRHINLVLVNKVAPGDARPAESVEAIPVEAPAAQPPAQSELDAAAEPVPAPEPKAQPAARDAPPRVEPRVQRAAPPAAPGSAAAAAAQRAEVAQHGARAIRRELVDPRHPMARLLATAPERVMRSSVPKELARSDQEVTAASAAPPAALEPPRPVHVFGPDPEPEQEQPATLEALAARFGQRREAPTAKAATKVQSKNERSRAEREKQAQILAKLREDSAKFVK